MFIENFASPRRCGVIVLCVDGSIEVQFIYDVVYSEQRVLTQSGHVWIVNFKIYIYAIRGRSRLATRSKSTLLLQYD